MKCTAELRRSTSAPLAELKRSTSAPLAELRRSAPASPAAELNQRISQVLREQEGLASPDLWLLSAPTAGEDALPARPCTLREIDLLQREKVIQHYGALLSDACVAPPNPPNACLASENPLSAFLRGPEPVALAPRLQWFAPLAQAMLPSDPERYAATMELTAQLLDKEDRPPSTVGEVLYHALQSVPAYDPGLVRLLLRESFPERTFHEYDVVVAKHISNMYPKDSYERFKLNALCWRDQGLTHVLLLAATQRPELADWLPEGLCATPAGRGLGEALRALRRPTALTRLEETLRRFVGTQGPAEDPASLHVAASLDALATLMRVKSNPGRHSGHGTALCDNLDLHHPLGDAPLATAWRHWKEEAEKAFPPSLLCPNLQKRAKQRPTWGYQGLTLQLGDRATLTIAENNLEWLVPRPPLDEPLLPSFQCEWRCSAGRRLQDTLSKLGVALTCPEVTELMLGDNVWEPQQVLDIMTCPGIYRIRAEPDVSKHLDALRRRMPSSVRQEVQREVVAWRVDAPNLVVVAKEAGGMANPLTFAPHLVPKRLLRERCRVPSLSRIHLAVSSSKTELRAEPNPAQAVEQVRRSLLHYAQTRQLPQEEPGGGGAEAQAATTPHTSLSEGVLCFVMQAAPYQAQTHTGLHESQRWQKNYEDSRYAEVQQGANGARYRDWISVYADRDVIQKVKLDSHVFRVGALYSTFFPWKRGDGGLTWVPVQSSVSVPPTLLCEPKLSPASQPATLAALASSVRAKYLQDLTALPTERDGDKVERSDVSVYTDDEAQQVMLAYAPLGAERIHVIAFAIPTPGRV